MALIHEQLIKVMADVRAVSKGTNKVEGKYNYRSIEDVYKAVQPVLVKHKVFNILSVEEKREREFKTASGSVWNHTYLKVRYSFLAEDGSGVDVVLWGEGADNGDKGSNKALSQAHKYAICQLLCLPYEAGEAKETPEQISDTATKEQHKELSMAETVKAFKQELKDKLKKAGFDTLAKAFKAYQGVAGDLDALEQLCDEKIKKG